MDCLLSETVLSFIMAKLCSPTTHRSLGLFILSIAFFSSFSLSYATILNYKPFIRLPVRMAMARIHLPD